MTLPDFVNNAEKTACLAEVLKLLLRGAEKAFFSSPYFNMGGYKLIAEDLEKLSGFYLLLGREPTRDEIMIGAPLGGQSGDYLAELQERLSAYGEEVLDEPEGLETIRRFLEFLERDEVEVRLFKENFLHLKSYIIQGVPNLGTVAITGSSNFTRGGLATNREWNTVHKQEAMANEVLEEFTALWNKSEDFKEPLKSIVSRFTKEYTPYEIYLKALWELFRDDPQFAGREEDKYRSIIELTDFQDDAVNAARKIIKKYGGVLIADSTGLGKTYIGLKLLEEFAYRDRRKALVICPAQLEDRWERDLLDHTISGEVVSMERLGRESFDPSCYTDCEVILVEESHNFRNGKSKRYRALMEIIKSGSQETLQERKVILMTATPVNNTVWDLYNQLMLCLKDNDFAFPELGSLERIFWDADKRKGDITEVLEKIAIRRSRRFIKEHYPKATLKGKPVSFPKRELENVAYSLEEKHPGIYKKVTGVIENLWFAPYQLDFYTKRSGVARYRRQTWERITEALKKESKIPEREIQEFQWTMGRQRALATIMRILLLKRFESSAAATIKSMETQKEFQAMFLENIQAGRKIDSATFRRIKSKMRDDIRSQADEGDETLEVDLSEYLEDIPEIDPNEYELDLLKQDIQEDIQRLESAITKLKKICPNGSVGQDDKIDKLVDLIRFMRGKKLLIFTYFKDTADYIMKNLKKRFPDRIRVMESITGATKPKEKTEIVRRFAPKSNPPGLKPNETEIEILISTDVLSEGQNLQDSDTVINYDLHWNPVRMIQRAGRIDRMESSFDKVFIYNFFPEKNLEDLLGIVAKLQDKIHNIDMTVGSEQSILGEEPLVKDFNAISGSIKRIYAMDGSILDDLEAEMEGQDISEILKGDLLEFLKKGGQALEATWGIGSGKKSRDTAGIIFIFVNKRANGSDQYLVYIYDKASEEFRILDRFEGLRRMRCNINEARVVATEEKTIYQLAREIRKHAVEVSKKRAALPPPKYPQSEIIRFLQALVSDPYNTPTDDVGKLMEYFRQPLSRNTLSCLRSLWKVIKSDEIKNKLSALEKFAEHNPRISSPVAAQMITIEEKDIKLLCYMELT